MGSTRTSRQGSRKISGMMTEKKVSLRMLVMMTTMMVIVKVSGTQDQPEMEQNSVVVAPHLYSVTQGSQKGQVEEVNDKPASIDHLLEEAARPNHLSFEDGEDAGCTPGTVLSELDVCLTREQMSHFMPVSLPHNSISSKSSGGGGGNKQQQQQQQRQKRQTHRLIFSLWTGAVVPYAFNTTFPHRDRMLVTSAMAEWERVTCIRFRPATPEDRDIVVFNDGKRCSTNIGRVGGHQLMTLAQPCRRKRILIHELGHVLGLIHEHQRQDRDNYVTVMLHNVRNSSQERYQFSKLAPSPLTDGQVQYSYTSIMHYGKNYFAKSPELTTLLTADPKYQEIIGRAEVPADSDAEAVNLLYGCAAPTLNRLPDSTCELFKRTGECEGMNKATILPLCPRSCRLQQQQQGYRSHVGGYPPTRTTSQLSSAHRKTHNTLWGQSSNVIGLGTRIADTLISATIHPAPAPHVSRLEPSVKHAPVYGSLPQRPNSRPFTLRQPQPLPQRQPQPRPQPQQSVPTVSFSKWFPSVFKSRSSPSRGTIQIHQATGPNQLPSWFRSRPPRTRATPRPKATHRRRNKLPERQMGIEAGGHPDLSMAAHNMKALSPEALPEASGRTPPSRDRNFGARSGSAHQDRTQYSYDRPQHMSLLQSMLNDGTLPRETPQEGMHVTRPLHSHGSASYSHSSPSSHSSGHSDQGPAHGPVQSSYSSVQVQPSRLHSPGPPTATDRPTLLGLLAPSPRDSWSQPSSSSSFSTFRRNSWTPQSSGYAPSPHQSGPSARRWYLGRAPSQGGGGGGLAGGFDTFRASNRHSRVSGPAMNPAAPTGPDSPSFYV